MKCCSYVTLYMVKSWSLVHRRVVSTAAFFFCCFSSTCPGIEPLHWPYSLRHRNTTTVSLQEVCICNYSLILCKGWRRHKMCLKCRKNPEEPSLLFWFKAAGMPAETNAKFKRMFHYRDAFHYCCMALFECYCADNLFLSSYTIIVIYVLISHCFSLR